MLYAHTKIHTCIQLEELMNWTRLCHQHPEHVPRVTIPSRDSGNPWGGSGEHHFLFSVLVFLRMLSHGAGVPFSFYLPYLEILCLLSI